MVGDISEENATGMLEFVVQGGMEDDFFPTSVEFESTETFLKTAVGFLFFYYIIILCIGDGSYAGCRWKSSYFHRNQNHACVQLHHRLVFITYL